MALSTTLTLTNTLQTLVSADADNDKAPLRAVRIECDSASANDALFVLTYKDTKTQSIRLKPGDSRELGTIVRSDVKGIVLVQAKNAVDDAEAIGTCDTLMR